MTTKQQEYLEKGEEALQNAENVADKVGETASKVSDAAGQVSQAKKDIEGGLLSFMGVESMEVESFKEAWGENPIEFVSGLLIIIIVIVAVSKVLSVVRAVLFKLLFLGAILLTGYYFLVGF